MLRELHDLPIEILEPLATRARGEGYSFLDRLGEEWRSGTSRFDGPGERLLGHFDNARLVAIGGLHADPYASRLNAGHQRIGRLRRVYVSPEYRRAGVASGLVRGLLADAARHYDIIRLRVPDRVAAAFYEAIGFAAIPTPDATHILRLP